MKTRLCIATMLLAAASIGTFAEENDSTIVDHINDSGTITVDQPAALNERLRKVVTVDENIEITDDEVSATAQKVRAGYRIQVFDDNNIRTAKTEAQHCRQMMQARFPEYATYVTFNSPYWRVKVGDFRTRSEAEAALAEIKHAFPAMSKSLRIVRDRIVRQ